MNWSNVKLILAREVRDQLRDRRTLFMIAVLPLLLYPLLGMSFFQVSQFLQEQTTSVLVIGAKPLGTPGIPPLVKNNHFADDLTSESEREKNLLTLHFASDEPPAVKDGVRLSPQELLDAQLAQARRDVQSGKYDAALYFPPDFAARLDTFRQAVEQQRTGSPLLSGEGQGVRGTKNKQSIGKPPHPGPLPEGEGEHRADLASIPSPEIICTTANEKSQLAYNRLSNVLSRWSDEVRKTLLAAGGVPVIAARPFEVTKADVAERTPYHRAAIWSKIIPVLLLLWAMTGAFYPAVDLCAGEKERGTLETLLSSPAHRSEIVLGKLLTIMLFSMVTVILNLASGGFTIWQVFGHKEAFALPPVTAMVWLAVALVPVSALFSALCLALAAFARSTKEGQYYLMPLLLVTMPLAVLPMAPGVELNLGLSLIPVAGLVLLLRNMLEGNYWLALQYAPPVVAVTLTCCLLSIRWAVDQFNSESVLFRESERLDLGLWLRHLLRDRQPTPTAAAAIVCGVTILMIRFFLTLAIGQPGDFAGLLRTSLVSQLVVVAMPALLMTIMFTTSPWRTLLLARWSPATFAAIGMAAVLAVVIHPLVMGVHAVLHYLYPLPQASLSALQVYETMLRQAPLGPVILAFAVLPAVCEELAFRGFVLSGLRHLGHKWRAIVWSALFFGFSHAVLQQQLAACLLGVVIGYVAVQSGNLLPGIVFHGIYNSLTMLVGRTVGTGADSGWLGWLTDPTQPNGCLYTWPAIAASVVLSGVLLAGFAWLPYPKSAEEELQETIERRAAVGPGGDEA